MMCKQSGMALIITMWLLFVLTIIAIGIGTLARTEAHISRNQADLISCKWAARAGINCAVAELDSIIDDQQKYLYLGEDTFTLSSDDLDIDLGDYEFEVKVYDELGRININYAPVETLAILFDSSEIADSVVDWRDSDDTPGPGGAETEYYASLKPSYSCRNTDFLTTREICYVKDITPDLLSQSFSDSGISIEEMLTVYSQNDQNDSGNNDQVDIQSADRESLQNRLGDVLNQQDIDSIINYRTNSRFTYPAQIVRVPGLDRSKIEEVYDRLTVSGTNTQQGRININTTSVDVLSVQQYLDLDIAQAIVDYRFEHGAFDGVGRLLAISDVTNEVFENAAKYFRVNSGLFKIVSAGHRKNSAVSASITYVVDLSNGSVKIRYRKE
ncbi:MAG: helix-hairpin-helix domain-containing protein [Armatimonadota bacterium]